MKDFCLAALAGFFVLLATPQHVAAQVAIGETVTIRTNTNLRKLSGNCSTVRTTSQETVAVVNGPAINTKCVNGQITTMLPVTVNGEKFLVSQSRVVEGSKLKLGTATVNTRDGLNLRYTNLKGEVRWVIPKGTKVDIKSVKQVLVDLQPREEVRVLVNANGVWISGFVDGRFLTSD